MARSGNSPARLTREAFLAAMSELRVAARFDSFSDRAELRVGDGDWGPMTDALLRRLWADSEVALGFLPPISTFGDLVLDLAGRNPVDPLGAWVESLRWDGTPRLDAWLARYLGTEDTALTRAMGRATLIGAVRRARRPGAKHDAMLVVEGAQGQGKSAAVRALCPMEGWFSDALDLASAGRELLETSSGKFLIEAADLSGLGRADLARLKAFLTRQTDRARPAYGRAVVERPRRFIIVGTTNPAAGGYLSDTTGGRRFWPVRCGRIDLDSLGCDRDQLWAEAAEAEAAGEPNWLVGDREAEAREEQDARRVGNPWEDALARLLDGVRETSTARALDLLGVPLDRRDRRHEMMAAEAIKLVGFSRAPKQKGVARLWIRE